MPFGTALLLYTGVGAAAPFGLFVVIGLCLLIVTQFRRRGEAHRNDPAVYSHPVRCSSPVVDP